MAKARRHNLDWNPFKPKGRQKFYWIGGGTLENLFGIKIDNIKKAGLYNKIGDHGAEYNLKHFVLHFKKQIVRNLQKELSLSDVEIGLNNKNSLQNEKLQQDIRKVKIANDLKEETLVAADTVQATYIKGMRAVCDQLDGIPSQVKMRMPDIDPAALAVIQEVLANCRNISSNYQFSTSARDEDEREQVSGENFANGIADL